MQPQMLISTPRTPKALSYGHPGSPVFPAVDEVASTDEFGSASSLSAVLNQIKP